MVESLRLDFEFITLSYLFIYSDQQTIKQFYIFTTQRQEVLIQEFDIKYIL